MLNYLCLMFVSQRWFTTMQCLSAGQQQWRHVRGGQVSALHCSQSDAAWETEGGRETREVSVEAVSLPASLQPRYYREAADYVPGSLVQDQV